MQFELTREFVEHLRNAVNDRDESHIHEMLDELHSADVSAVLYELGTDECIYIFSLLEEVVCSKIIRDLDEDTREKFLKNFSPEVLASYVQHLESDDAADVLNEQTLQTRQAVILALPEEPAENIVDLLKYEEDCAGGLMAKELIKANVNWNVVQCIDEIRRQREKVSKIHSIYVVDDKDKLLGRVSLKKLLLSSDQVLIADIFEQGIVAVETFKDEDEVVELMSKYDLEAIPVINVHGKLLGRITIDDVVDVMREQQDEERALMAGVSENIEQDDSVWRISRARLPWLIIGVLGGMVGAKILSLYEGQLAKVSTLAFFIPLITATGGNVGIQSSSIVVQSLATKTIIKNSMYKDVVKSFIVALINGFAISGLVFLTSVIVVEDYHISLVVSLALYSVIILASLMGTITPLVLSRFNVNPALASGPFITTANDLIGIIVYFAVASLLLENL